MAVTYAMRAARTMRQGAVIAIADFRAFYTWRTWLGGWLVRILFQVIFYLLLAAMVGDAEYVAYVVIGAALMVSVAEAMMTAASTTWDIPLGTLPLLAASPANPGFFYVGRSIHWPTSAVATTSIALLSLSPFVGISWSPVQVVLVVLLVAVSALSTYGMALVVGAAALLAPGARNVMSTIVTMATTAFCGAVVPVAFWPPAVQWAAQAIPVTHGLEAVRLVHAEAGIGEVASAAGLAVLVGLSWLTLALVAFNALFTRARRGSALLM
jgi:ABC-2 type transport system permease protein